VRIPSIEVTIFIARTLSGSSACPNGKPLRLRRVADLSRSGAESGTSLLPSFDRWPTVAWVMPKGCYHLGEMTAAMIRLYCPECHRLAQFKRAKLQFGTDKPMPTMLRDLKPYNIGGGTSGPQCQLRYWDSMTPDARAEASAKASSFVLRPTGKAVVGAAL
jgi:hypothetical protein